MNTSVVIYSGQLRTENTHLASGHTILTDAPKDNFGLGEYFSPTDLLSTSLANCILTTMAIAMRRSDLDLTGARAYVKKYMGTDPRRVIRIDVRLELPGKAAAHREQLEQAAHNCPVAKSLHPGIQQNIDFVYVD